MTDVEKIALWVGLISSIVSIVLSIVAIVFAAIVDRSARNVSAQTIKSLQKIESYVERLSSDTTGLIKAGWDRMLGNVARPAGDDANNSAKEIAAGLLAEMRAELGLSEDNPDAVTSTSSTSGGEKLDEAFENLKSSLEAQLRTQRGTDRPGEAVDRIVDLLRSLSAEARALATVIGRINYHITFDQFQRLLRKSPLGDALSELRDHGLLIPHEGLSSAGKPIPVYYFPTGLVDTVRAALLLLPEIDRDLEALVISELEAVGYFR
jgi:hypothetical protein